MSVFEFPDAATTIPHPRVYEVIPSQIGLSTGLVAPHRLILRISMLFSFAYERAWVTA